MINKIDSFSLDYYSIQVSSQTLSTLQVFQPVMSGFHSTTSHSSLCSPLHSTRFHSATFHSISFYFHSRLPLSNLSLNDFSLASFHSRQFFTVSTFTRQFQSSSLPQLAFTRNIFPQSLARLTTPKVRVRYARRHVDEKGL
jgi:hypothetical protein